MASLGRCRMPKERKNRSLHPALRSKCARIKTLLTTADADEVRTRYELGTPSAQRGASLAACSAADVVGEGRARCPHRMFQRSGRRFQRRCLRWDKGRTGLPLRSPSTHTSRLTHPTRSTARLLCIGLHDCAAACASGRARCQSKRGVVYGATFAPGIARGNSAGIDAAHG